MGPRQGYPPEGLLKDLRDLFYLLPFNFQWEFMGVMKGEDFFTVHGLWSSFHLLRKLTATFLHSSVPVPRGLVTQTSNTPGRRGTHTPWRSET